MIDDLLNNAFVFQIQNHVCLGLLNFSICIFLPSQLTHSHKKWKDTLETGTYCWYFRLNLKYLECSYRAYIKTSKNIVAFVRIYLVKMALGLFYSFCCYDHGAKASEVVKKIAAVQKEYRECSSCVKICWIVKIYLSINNSEKRLVRYWNTSDVS